MKGIILAGGSGTRLYPSTEGISKQALDIYDKPMIYYPLSVLMLASIKDILIITTPEDQEQFKRILGDGSNFGIHLEYQVQEKPEGLAQAFTIGLDFIGNETCAMILGDNIFYGNGFVELLKNARENAENGNATVFGYEVKDPNRFGIMEIDENKKILSVEEKPEKPKSNYAITGLYFYPKGVSQYAKNVTPSHRGELEITTLNDMYLKEERLAGELLGGGYLWFDTGTHKSKLTASNMIFNIQDERGKYIACLEEIAYKNKWITKEQLLNRGNLMHKNDYGQHLLDLANK